MARKITEQAITAFMAGEYFFQSNTLVTSDCDGLKSTLYLFGIAIAKREGKQVSITAAGHQTMTTKERLNGIDGVSIYQKNNIWYLNDKAWHTSGDWIPLS